MIRTVKVRKVGGSVSATLPRDMVEHLHIEPGDELVAVETERGILLTPYDPDFERGMALYRRGAKKYRNALRELAH